MIPLVLKLSMTSVLFFLAFEDANSFEVQKLTSPPGKSGLSAPTNVTQPDRRQQSSAKWVRFGLIIKPFKPVVFRNQQGEKITKSAPLKPIRRTLRAKIDRPNHFYIDQYHVETTPLEWIKVAGRYRIKITLSQRFGKFKQLEELMGQLVVDGVLEGDGDILILKGMNKKRIRNEQGLISFDLIAGYQPSLPAITKNYQKPKPLPVPKEKTASSQGKNKAL